jgi:hypothetical protein
MPVKKPAKPPVKQQQRATVSKALRVEVFVSRGDVSLKSETTAGDALAVARFMIATVRQLASEAPDLLPHIEHVPGDVLPYDWTEEMDAKVKIQPLGFR